jgi:hypothetical protein
MSDIGFTLAGMCNGQTVGFSRIGMCCGQHVGFSLASILSGENVGFTMGVDGMCWAKNVSFRMAEKCRSRTENKKIYGIP